MRDSAQPHENLSQNSGAAPPRELATDAALNLPYGLALDAGGNMFVADDGNFRIRRIDATTGFISTVAGDGVRAFAGDEGPATSASFVDPKAVVVDGAGSLFVADSQNNRGAQG